MYSAKPIGDSERQQKHKQEFLQFALSQSLNRSQTDYLDVYSLHNPTMDAIENDKLFSSLDDLVKKDTIKSHGVALGPAIGWKEEGLEAIEKRNITCLQTVYNILEQVPARDFMQAAERRNVGIMVRVPDASGLRSEEHTSELQSRQYLVCRLLLEKKKNKTVEYGSLQKV